MSITLYPDPNNDNLHQVIGASEANLQNTAVFKRAVVTTGTWILYTYPNFNDAQSGGEQNNYKILEEAADVDISSVNGSIYLLPDAVDGVVLFEHSFYGGSRMRYDGPGCPDITTIFPAGKIGGVSSAIVLATNQKWSIFTEAGYKGLSGTLMPAKRYENPAAMEFPNDSIKSIRKM